MYAYVAPSDVQAKVAAAGANVETEKVVTDASVEAESAAAYLKCGIRHRREQRLSLPLPTWSGGRC